MSIRFKLILGALAFLLLFIAVFVASSVVTASQKTDGLVIRIAARQGVLTEKMTKELLRYSEEPTDEHWATFQKTRDFFDTSLNALLNGGPVRPHLIDETVPDAKLPKATDGQIKEKLEGVEEIFARFRDASGKVKVEANDAASAADTVIEQTPVLIAKYDSVVSRAQKASEDELVDADGRREWAKIIQYASRQRMLAQRLTTLALEYLRGPNDERKKRIESLLDVFDTTHHALESGGTVILDPEDPTEGEMIAPANNPRVQERLADAGDRWASFRRALNALKLSAASNASALKDATSRSPALLGGIGEVVDRAQTLSEDRVRTLSLIQICALLAGVILVIVAAFMGHRIGSNMKTAVRAAQTIAEGDLTARSDVNASDETGRLLVSLNQMGEQLSELVSSVQHSGVSVGSSSSQIAESARLQESAVSELASTATEIAATSTEIAATAEELLDTMNEVGRVSESTSRGASNSKMGLEEMQRTMDQMVASTETVTDRLSAINQKTAKISTVVGTIMKIAQQTNLISLNAAIEAENAGELGLGFAVVAKEVRRLADQTTKASTGVEQMVGEMQSAVSTAVMGMDGFQDDIRTGSDAVRDVVSRLGRIIDRVELLAPRFESVREGMSAQAEGAHQIAEGVRQIVDSSEETAESVRQTNMSIEDLTRAAGELQQGVTRFKVAENGV